MGGKRAPPSPVGCVELAAQQRVHRVIDEGAVKRLAGAQDAFEPEAEPLRNGAAVVILRAGRDLDAIQVERQEAVAHHEMAALRHDAAALAWRREPVADLTDTIDAIERQVADDSRERTVANDAERRTA